MEKNYLNFLKKSCSNLFGTLLLLFCSVLITHAQSADFKQGSNQNKPQPLGKIIWINSILNNNNSEYAEGMATLQRMIITNIPATTNDVHKFVIKMEGEKANHHAYDFMISWDQAFESADELGGPIKLLPYDRSDPDLEPCGPNLQNSLYPICEALHAGTNWLDIPITDGSAHPVLTGDLLTVPQVIANFESKFGPRKIRIYGDQAIESGSVQLIPSLYTAPYIYYEVTWKSPSTQIILEFAAHIAAGIDPFGEDIGYGPLRGAADINGGPYHVICEGFTTGEGSIGNMDNQLQGANILLSPECNLTGPDGYCLGGPDMVFNAGGTNLDDPVYLWSFDSNNTGATIVSGQGTEQITVDPGTTGGIFTIKVRITNNGGLFTECWKTVTITGGTLTCPGDMTKDPCLSQAAIDAAFDAWLASVVVTGSTASVTTDWDGMYPDKCGDVVTVTFSVNDECVIPNECTCTFTVLQAKEVTLTPPVSGGTAACQTQDAVNAAFDSWLTGVQFSGGCSATLSDDHTTAPDHCGGAVTVTWAVSSLCEPDVTGSATFTVPDAPALSLSAPESATVSSCLTQEEVNDAFDDWMNSLDVDGGCDPDVQNDWDGEYPDHCGDAVTIHWTVTDMCEGPATLTSTFTVTEAPGPVTLTAPDDETVNACLSQSAVNALFDAWMLEVQISGGCNPVPENDWDGTYPNHCGSIVTVTWSESSDCDDPVSDQAVFTVTAPMPEWLNVPADETVASCKSQAEVNGAFAAWLLEEEFGGGCSPRISVNPNTAPSHCGGVVTVTWTVTSECEAPVMKHATFTVLAPAPVTITCPPDLTVDACLSQSEVDAAFGTWLTSVDWGGGCNAEISNDNTGAPDHCGGTMLVTWTVTSDCEADKTCSATFTVTDAPPVTLVCPPDLTVDACLSQSEVDAAFGTWLASVDWGGGCNAEISNDNTGAPDHCWGTTMVTWTVTSDCEADKTCSATFTVTAPQPIVVNCPDPVSLECSPPEWIQEEYDLWRAGFTKSGDCDLTDNLNDLPEDAVINPDGSVSLFEFTFTVTGTCSEDHCTSSFEAKPCPKDFCTYTQGFYGSQKGKACDLTATPKQGAVFTASLLAEGPMVIGAGSNKITFGTGDAELLKAILPGGGGNETLSGICDPPAWDPDNIDFGCLDTYLKNRQHRLTNTLLAQTITLGLNMRIGDNRLGRVELKADQYLVTQKKLSCTENTGYVEPVCANNTIQNPDIFRYFKLSEGVKCLMLKNTTKYPMTIQGLFNLANDALGNVITFPVSGCTVTLSGIAEAVDGINNVFDECSRLVGYQATPKYTCPAPIGHTSATIPGDHPTVLGVYPNPFNQMVTFEFVPGKDANATLEIHNLVGQKITTLLNRSVKEGVVNKVNFTPFNQAPGIYIYRLLIDDEVMTGKIIYNR